jgi:hypothetical protein
MARSRSAAGQQFRRYPRRGPTLADWLPDWLAGKAASKPSTRASYRAHTEKYLIPMLGGIRLRDLSAQHIQAWHRDLLDAGVTPATIARIHATLSSALSTARRQGLIDRNPLSGVELPRRRPFRRSTWTQQEAAVFPVSGARRPAGGPVAARSDRRAAARGDARIAVGRRRPR